MIFLKPISKGNFRLPLLVDTEEIFFSMHPSVYVCLLVLDVLWFKYEVSVGLCRKFRLKFGLNFDKFRVWIRTFWWAFIEGSGSLAGSLLLVDCISSRCFA